MAPLIGGLATVARETDAALILIHHRSNKGGAASSRGSSAIEDQADIIYTLDKGRGPLRRLSCHKLRVGAEPPPIALSLQIAPLRLITGSDSLIGQLDSLNVPAEGWSLATIGQAVGIDTQTEAGRKRLQRSLQAGQWVSVKRGVWAPPDVPRVIE
jgi:hypothetical protein